MENIRPSHHRNHVLIRGTDSPTMIFAHGFGCDQNMWRFVAPAFEDSHRVVTFDYVGAGNSDLSQYDPRRYATLEGYALDVIEIVRELDVGPVVFVGHSVSSMIGMIASIRHPELFSRLVMLAPSPSFINSGDYEGGMTREQVEHLVMTLQQNYLGWSESVTPVIMGNPDRPELTTELRDSFCRMRPDIAKQFARVTFLSDCRPLLSDVTTPALIAQCSVDSIAPASVGDYLHRNLQGSTLVTLKATGHCPNLSAPDETIAVIREYLSH